MDDTQHFFGGGGQTDVQPLTLVLVLIAVALLMLLPRRYILVPLLIASVLVSLGQQILIVDLHITMSRLLLAVGWLRILGMKFRTGQRLVAEWTRLDVVFLLYCFSNVITYVLLWAGDSGAIINRLGFLYNSCTMYFFVRFTVRTRVDVTLAIKVLVWVFTIIAVSMSLEQVTGRNSFFWLGGVPLLSTVRDGQIRSAGPFAHPLTAGAIGATLAPLAIGLWWVDQRSKWTCVIGNAAAIVMAVTSRSSTGILTLAAAAIGLLLWKWRQHMKLLRRTVVLVLVTLHLVMKAPVWALLARIDLTGSSSGYHRYVLIDQCISRFSEWWLIGTRTTETWGWDMWDTINSYVAAATSGGLVNLALFVSLFVVGFQLLGTRMKYSSTDRTLVRLWWIMGVLLFVHAVAFFGIAYFDQSQFVWYADLAMISSAVVLKPEGQPSDHGSTARTQEECNVPAMFL